MSSVLFLRGVLFVEVPLETRGAWRTDIDARFRRHVLDMPWHRTPQEAFASAGVETACDLDASPGFEYSVVKTRRDEKKTSKHSGCWVALFPRRRRSVPRIGTDAESGDRPIPTIRTRDVLSTDTTTLHAMRFELDEAVAQADSERKRLTNGRARTDVLEPAVVHCTGKTSTANQSPDELEPRSPINLPKMENLMQSIVNSLEPVQAFCDSKAVRKDSKSSLHRVPELTRLYESRK